MLSQAFFLAALSSTVYAQAFVGGRYLIQSPRTGTYARNFPGGTQQGPTLNAISFGLLGPSTGPYASWNIDDSPAGWTIVNSASQNKAFVSKEVAGAPIQGFSEVATPFAIEPAGADTWVIKSINSDLLWTVGEDQDSIDQSVVSDLRQLCDGIRDDAKPTNKYHLTADSTASRWK
ncbi:hypothetical protein D9619_003813 [Psilocybe cf. subviscida]|uniref:Uncharacterized protein n=1 Tax=Psilocybe cf. subviscida TaxID=2480587 RepID=A0A8H5AX11_9AGAR|nr:hypothetical protein D9619_003813 [Psilocybe cf. subviscida]